MENKKIISDIKKYVKSLLGPQENYFYHHYDHAIDVMQRAIYIGKKEGVNKSDLEILAIAALFHDSGFSVQYNNNEIYGAKIAENYLKKIGYPNDKIKTIKRLIIATDPSYKDAIDLLEEVIKDADLDNLGRDDFFKKGKKLKRELEFINKTNIGKKQWQRTVMKLMSEHSFLTRTQRKERLEKKDHNMRMLEKSI